MHRGTTNATHRLLLTVGVMVLLNAPASACPFCEGGPSGRNEVSEAIFGDGFWFNVVAAASPFVLLLAITAAIHGVPPRRKITTRTESPKEGAFDGRSQ